jgi:hypothetical protein
MIAQSYQIHTRHSNLGLDPNDVAFNLSRLDSLATDLDLSIDPTEMDKRAIGILPNKVSCPVHATSRRQAK